MITEIIVIMTLIVLNGILSASEIAVVSSRKARLQVDANTHKGARQALKLKENPNQFLSTVQIGITLIGIMTGYFSGGTISAYLHEELQAIPALSAYSNLISTSIVVIVITFLSLVIGELVPKRIGMAIPEKYASLIAIPMSVISVIVKPFVWVLSASTDLLVKLLNIKSTKNSITEEEIKAIVDEGVDSGVIEDFEHDMVDRILEVGDKKAINLMVHRSDIIYLNLQDSIEDIKTKIKRYNHNEYPVCDGTFDQVKGIIDAKALLGALLTHNEINLSKLIRPIPFVSENSNVYTVLDILTSTKQLQAVVVDEYGSPQGIITAKEIMFSMVGGFEDTESTTKSKSFRQREDGSYILEGRYQLDDFYDKFNIIVSEEEEEDLSNVTTIGGLVFLLLDHVPSEGEYVIFKGYRLEVIDMDGNRVDKVALEKLH